MNGIVDYLKKLPKKLAIETKRSSLSMSLIFETITMVSGVAAAAGDLALSGFLGSFGLQARGAGTVGWQRDAVSGETFG